SQLSGAKVKGRHAISIRFAMLSLFFIGIGTVLGWWLGDVTTDPEWVSRSELQVAERQIAGLKKERDRLQAIANDAESQINIEKATQAQLADQARRLTQENNRLKEDLAFFEKLLPAKNGRGISIRSLNAELIAPNQIRYRVLIMQGGKNPAAFVGELQLAVMLVADEDKANAMIVFPQENTSE